jgi:DUF1680 family protein
METNYPRNGKVTIKVDPVKKSRFALHIRIPGWVNKSSVAGGLYTMQDSAATVSYRVNGKQEIYKEDGTGYAVIERSWSKNDVLEFEYAMPVTQLTSRNELKQNKDRVALQRGPLVYCVEGADNNGKAWNILFPEKTMVSTLPYQVLDEPVIAIEATVPVINTGADGISLQTQIKKITAIPYYTWCNRGSNPMQVWMPVKINDVKLNY